MKTIPWILRVYGERCDNQWSLICLDFNLTVQADSLDEAQTKLLGMTKSYLNEALAADGPDHRYAEHFLRRRAPWGFWVKYYIALVRAHLGGTRDGKCGKRIAKSEAIPMVPAGA
ncbi:hypothetical protein [Castellaniella sp.]|uniref:hypothetical protein n=1 Tax=Castellaniella sp. TaxID=1955812 RepID=UPI00355F541E